MGTLTSSSSKVFSNKSRDRDRSILSPQDVLRRPEIRFFRPPKHACVGFTLSVSLKYRTLHPRFSASSLSPSDTQTDIQIQDIAQPKTVHVKFQLQRECSFGQQFLIVGDDPMFGLWDPSSAVPLNWSDGHVWTVELDIPVGKSIEFKFILKGGADNILWQPGPDRILQTWETKNTITVSEDWDNAELQKIIEEELTSEDHIGETTGGNIFGNKGSALNAKDLATAKDDDHLVSDQEVVPVLVPGWTPLPTAHTEETSPNEVKENIAAEASLGTDTSKDLNVPEDQNTITVSKDWDNAELQKIVEEELTSEDHRGGTTGGNIFGNNGSALNAKDLATAKDDDPLVSDEEVVPVLVPGLTPLPTAHTEEASPNEVEENIAAEASLGTDSSKDLNVPEEEPDNQSQHQKETTGIVYNEEHELDNYEQIERLQLAKEQESTNTKLLDNGVFGKDIQWGRRTLQKLLTNMGFL